MKVGQNNKKNQGRNPGPGSSNGGLVRVGGRPPRAKAPKTARVATKPVIQYVQTPPVKEKIVYRDKKESPGKQWWNLSGDMLYKYGAKALDYGKAALTGFGDYELETNSLLAAATNGKQGNEVPIMHNSKVVNIIRHREYIGDIFGSTSDFKLDTYRINPGSEKTFPWLSPIASSYTNYRLRGAMFEFVTLATDYAALPYLGYVAMATNYNAIQPEWLTKKELENSEYASSAKPSETFCHPVECKKSMLAIDELYIRKDNTVITGDPRLYDLGNFYIAVGGQQSNSIIGELWLTYEVEFFFPVLARGGSATLCDTFDVQITANYTTGDEAFGRDSGRSVLINQNTTEMSSSSIGPNTLRATPEMYGKTFIVSCTWTRPSGSSFTKYSLDVLPNNGNFTFMQSPQTLLTGVMQMSASTVWYPNVDFPVLEFDDSSTKFNLGATGICRMVMTEYKQSPTSSSIPSEKMDCWIDDTDCPTETEMRFCDISKKMNSSDTTPSCSCK
jgi:hypothetical protein